MANGCAVGLALLFCGRKTLLRRITKNRRRGLYSDIRDDEIVALEQNGVVMHTVCQAFH